MADETQASKISKLVERLVARSVPPQRARGMCKFAMRVLGSRIEPSSCKDEFEVSGRIKKRILKAGAPKRGDGDKCGDGEVSGGAYSTALRFDELFRKLCASRTLQQRWAILHLLASLGDTADNGSVGAIRFRALDTLDLNAGRAAGAGGHAQPPSAASSSAPPPPASAASGGDDEAAAARLFYGRTPAAELMDKTSFEVSEHALIRDCLYAFQGINAEHVQRGGGGGSGRRTGDCYEVCSGVGAPGATRDLLSCCCELGWLYTRVGSFVSRALDNPALGMCGQALVHAVQEELTDYYRLVAVLEAHLSGKQQQQQQRQQGLPCEKGGVGSGGALTLRRLVVWVAEPLERMRLLATVCDAAVGLRGGALASSLRAHARHGDPFVAQFMGSLVARVAAPLFWMIRCWVLEGTLEDLHQVRATARRVLDGMPAVTRALPCVRHVHRVSLRTC